MILVDGLTHRKHCIFTGITNMTDSEFEKRLERMAADIAKQGEQLSRVMLVVFGSPDLEAEPITKQITQISAAVDSIAKKLDAQEAERTGQKKLLGLFGVRDIPSVIALILAIYTLGGKLGWWQ